MAFLCTPHLSALSMRGALGRTALMILFIFGLGEAQTLSPAGGMAQQIAYLQARGELSGLSPFIQPYDIGEIRSGLEGTAGKHALFLSAGLNRRRLEPGEASVAVVSDNRLLSEPFPGTLPGEAIYDPADAWLYYGRQRLELACRPKSWLQIFNTMLLDNRLDEHAGYAGIRQEGFASYTERAGVRLQHAGFTAVVGREFLRIGPGFDASLLVSPYSRPMDQIALGWRNRWLRYDFIAASLDPSPWLLEGGGARNRYISLHHLQVQPMRRLCIGIGEAMLYSSGAPEFNYLNPFLAWYGEVTNGPVGGNILGSVHIAAMPVDNLTLHADLLIDDIQLEKSGPGDLEPAEYGLIAGLRWADPLHLQGGDLYCEYTRITNRTFNGEGGPWERWLHRNEPIAHFLGNDFERWLAGFSWWPQPALRAACIIDLRRRGEGRIDKPFDRPWLDTPLGQEYSEPFPTGVVEENERCTLELSWQPRQAVRAHGRIGYCRISNLNHSPGLDRSEWMGSLGLEVDVLRKFSME